MVEILEHAGGGERHRLVEIVEVGVEDSGYEETPAADIRSVEKMHSDFLSHTQAEP